MKRFSILHMLILACSSTPAAANRIDSSPFLTGPAGLNTVPSARMMTTGTLSLNTSTLDPYIHTSLGIQIAEPLFINLRQSALISSVNDDAKRLYPGLDFKLLLLKESQSRPQIAIGLQSAVGHKRMAAEYLAASKRYKNFDFTAGLGWGRYGSAAHFNNPLKALSKHFGKLRNIDGDMPNEPNNWFTGEHIGVFGGIEYFTPLKGLSIKADYGADRYTAEQNTMDYSAPSPWSAGLNYAPNEWAQAGLAVQGFDKIMGRISLHFTPGKSPLRLEKHKTITPLHPRRSSHAFPANMQWAADKNGAPIFSVTADQKTANGHLPLSKNKTTPALLGRAGAGMTNHAGPSIEQLTLQTHMLNLKGPRITLMRRDLEHALAHQQGSSAEIWHNTTFEPPPSPFLKRQSGLISFYNTRKSLTFNLDNQISLSEEDSGILYRSALIAELEGPRFFGLLHSGTALRLNLANNLNQLADIRPQSLLPVRSNVHAFAKRPIALERAYTTYTDTLAPDLHIALSGGILEEMYGGAGGEVLYRPFGKRFALGAEGWLALKRDPSTSLNLGFNGDHLLSGHLNAWYSLPESSTVIKAKAGRYLAEDIGATLSIAKHFKNGAELSAYVSVTDNADYDLFGGTTHADHGLRLSLPLGSARFIPENSRANFKAAPFGRDIGQSMDVPLPLYELTQPLSYEHIATHWSDVLTTTPKQKTPP